MSDLARPMLGDLELYADWAEGRNEEALKKAQDIYFKRPDDVFAVGELGRALHLIGDQEGALRQYRRVFELEPHRYGSGFGSRWARTLAHAEAATGDTAAARETLAKVEAGMEVARNAGIDGAEFHAGEGILQAQLENDDAALAAFTEALARGWLPWTNMALPVPEDFAASPEFREILTKIETMRAEARRSVAERICRPDSAIPDSQLKAAICAALAGS